MHPQLTAAIIEISAADLADRGLLCEHLDYAIIGQSTFQQALGKQDDSIESAALATIAHLIRVGGQLLILGGSQQSLEQASIHMKLDPSSVSIASNDMQLSSHIDLPVPKERYTAS